MRVIPADFSVCNMNAEEFVSKIKQYDRITVFRHERPDCDAAGSQFGFISWVRDNFPGKKIYALGQGTCTQGDFPPNDEVTDDIVRGSLAVVFDTASPDRIDDERWQLAAEVINIDHHPEPQPYGNLYLIDTGAAAVCEILTRLLEETGYPISLRTAEYLYSGLLTDTLCFRTSNTTARTLEAAAHLAAYGIDIPAINRKLFDLSYSDFRFASYFRSRTVLYTDEIAYVKLHMEDMARFGVNGSSARNFIDEIGHVKEFAAWCAFTEKEGSDGPLYDASLRSKEIQINDIAAAYGGGGHRNAAGVKDLSESDVDSLLAAIKDRLASSKK